MKRTKKRLSIKILTRAAASAILCAMLFQLSSCSVIKINYDKFGGSGTEAGTNAETEPAGTVAPVTDEETKPFIPPVEYEYTGKKTAEERLSEIEYDFGRESVFIRSTYEFGISRILSFSEDDDNTFSAAKYERCRMIEERLSCELHYKVTTIEEMEKDIKAALSKGDYYADLLALTASDVVALASEGYLLDLYTLPFFSTDAEYFHEATVGLSAGSDAWCVVSAATVEPDDVPCVFYDRRKTGDKVEMLVNSGKWTWDELISLAGGAISMVSTEVNDGVAELDRKRLDELVSVSAGLEYISNTRGESPAVKLPEGLDAAAVLLRKLIVPGAITPAADTGIFASGEAVFHIGRLGDMNALADAKVDWDIAPIPKVTGDEDNYRAAMPYSSLFFAVPATTTNSAGASALLRAFAAASDKYLIDAYCEFHMYNTVRRESSVSMISRIYDTACYDLAHVYGRSDGDIRNGTYLLLTAAVDDAEQNIEKLFGKRRAAANRALGKLFPTEN